MYGTSYDSHMLNEVMVTVRSGREGLLRGCESSASGQGQ